MFYNVASSIATTFDNRNRDRWWREDTCANAGKTKRCEILNHKADRRHEYLPSLSVENKQL